MRLLIVPGFMGELSNANLYCLNELLKALKAYPDLIITVTGATLKEKDISVSWKKNPLIFAKKLFNWPVANPKTSENCYREIINELDSTQYDAILVAHRPYDGVLAAIRAKRKFPDVKLFLYELDPIACEMDKQRKSLGRYLYFMRLLAEKKTYRMCDKIFHMECNRTKYMHKKYNRYRKKFEYLDFPLIHNQKAKEETTIPTKNKKMKLIYTGTLMSYYRSPEYLLNVLIDVQKTVDMEILLFSKGDCENMIAEISKKHPFIQQRGYVDKTILDSELEACDFLINIGNKMSDMLPSKILTYLETGKPILHVKNQSHDACIPYLDKYDLSLIIDEADSVEVSAEKVRYFLMESFNKRLGSDEIVSAFPKNLPSYSAQVIYDYITEGKQL